MLVRTLEWCLCVHLDDCGVYTWMIFVFTLGWCWCVNLDGVVGVTVCTLGSCCCDTVYISICFVTQSCEEAIWCKLVTGHKSVTMGVVYRCPNITKESNEKIQNAIREVSKGDCIVMGDINHGNIQWDTLESTGVEDQQLMCLIQDNVLIQHVLEPTRGGRVLDLVLSSQKEFVDQRQNTGTIGQQRP